MSLPSTVIMATTSEHRSATQVPPDGMRTSSTHVRTSPSSWTGAGMAGTDAFLVRHQSSAIAPASSFSARRNRTDVKTTGFKGSTGFTGSTGSEPDGCADPGLGREPGTRGLRPRRAPRR